MHAETVSPIKATHGSWVNLLYSLGVPHFIDQKILNCWLIIIGLTVFVYLGTRRLDLLPRGVQNFLEWGVERLEAFTTLAMGPQGKAFAPFIGTLFIYILVMNLFGLIPGFISPTAGLNTTAALAIVVFFATQFHGIRRHGALGYVRHLMGDPWYLFPLMLPIHLLEELLARPLSLAVRLFGNIFGKETVIYQLAVMTAAGVFAGLGGVAVRSFTFAIQSFVMVIAFVISIVQAMIFALLAAVYIGGAIEAHDGH